MRMQRAQWKDLKGSQKAAGGMQVQEQEQVV